MQWVLLSSFVCQEHQLTKVKDLMNCWNVEQAPLNLLLWFGASFCFPFHDSYQKLFIARAP